MFKTKGGILVQVKKGTNRIVLVFPMIHLAIKFPIIGICTAMKGYKSRNLYAGFSVDSGQGPRAALFGGLLKNFREFCFYWKTRNPLLQPTYFSFFGFVNVQRADDPCTCYWMNLAHQFNDLTEGDTQEDDHHFCSSSNFSFCNGRLKMLDYGSLKTQKIVAQYGVKIVAQFNPEYDWENKKE
jgi:hypothetical protein